MSTAQSSAPSDAPPAAGGRGEPGREIVVAGVAAVLGAAAGALVAALVVTAAFIGAAEDMGREMTDGLGAEIGTAVSEGYVRAMEDSMAAYEEDAGYWEEEASPVEQFPPVAPDMPATDATLDASAEDCFDGNLQACDDLMTTSPPMSEYEVYASTCGGRVKAYTVMLCADLA